MGIIAKGGKCHMYQDVMMLEYAPLALPKLKMLDYMLSSSGKKSVLCKTHYKEWKKETKDDRSLERARYDKF